MMMKFVSTAVVLAAATASAAGMTSRMTSRSEQFVRDWTRLAVFHAEGWLSPVPCETTNLTVAAWGKKAPSVCSDIPSTGKLRARFFLDEDVDKKKLKGHLEYYAPNAGKRCYRTGVYRLDLTNSVAQTRWMLLSQPGAEVSFGGFKGAVPVRTELEWQGPVPTLRAPADGVTVRDNTPTFAWWPQAPGALLEIATDAAFTKVVRSEETDELPALTLEKPLPPGTYYWRVRNPLASLSAVRSFVQTAPVSADTTAPEIVALPQYLGRTDVCAHFTSGGPQETVRVRCALPDGSELKLSQKGNSYDVQPPAGGWAVGLTKLRVTAEDAVGNAVRADLFLMVHPGLLQVVWDKYRGFRIGDGDWFYPFGSFTLHGPEDAKRFSALGVNFAQSYARDSSAKLPPGPGSRFDEQMQALGKHGIRAMLAPGRMTTLEDKCGGLSSYEATAVRLGMIMGYREAVAYYLRDEPDLHGTTPVDMCRYYQFVHALDPTRPGLVICSEDGMLETFAACCDVYLSEAYSVTPAEAWEKFAAARRRLGNQPLLCTVDISACGDKDPFARLDPKFPRNRQVLNYALAGLMYGSGLTHWWWPRRNWKDPTQSVENYLTEARALADRFAAATERRVSSDGPLRIAELRGNGKTAWIVANASDKPVEFRDGRRLEPWAYLVSDAAVERMSCPQPLDVQALIDKTAKKKGGGTVTVKAGDWEVKPFVLKPGVKLFLEHGARLLATTNIADYACGNEHCPLVSAEGAENVGIAGPGVIDGRGFAFPRKKLSSSASQPKRPMLLRFTRCRNVVLEDFTYCQSGSWGCHLKNCDGVTVRRVTCYNHCNATNDGLDIESANVLVENCDFDTDDDAVVLKTESDRTFAVTNVVVRDCRLASACNGFKIGTGSYADCSGIRVEGCAFLRPSTSFRFDWRKLVRGVTAETSGLAAIALECVDGGRLSDVVVRDATVDGYQTPIFVRLGRRHPPATGMSSFLRDVLIENVEAACSDSSIASSITGVPGLRPQDIVLRNVSLVSPGGGTDADRTRVVPENEGEYPEANMFCDLKSRVYDGILPAWGLYIRHADDVRFENVRLSCRDEDARRPVVTDDCARFAGDIRIDAGK